MASELNIIEMKPERLQKWNDDDCPMILLYSWKLVKSSAKEEDKIIKWLEYSQPGSNCDHSSLVSQSPLELSKYFLSKEEAIRDAKSKAVGLDCTHLILVKSVTEAPLCCELLWELVAEEVQSTVGKLMELQNCCATSTSHFETIAWQLLDKNTENLFQWMLSVMYRIPLAESVKGPELTLKDAYDELYLDDMRRCYEEAKDISIMDQTLSGYMVNIFREERLRMHQCGEWPSLKIMFAGIPHKIQEASPKM